MQLPIRKSYRQASSNAPMRAPLGSCAAYNHRGPNSNTTACDHINHIGGAMSRQRPLSSEVVERLLQAGDDMSDYVHNPGRMGAGGVDQSFSYPWAAAPDIIRSHQKDAYFQSVLLGRLEAVLRSLYGSRTAHNWTSEARTFTELLYLGLTTLVGNRTLGEEYTDIVQVEDNTHRLPSLLRRSGYILSSVLLPYALTRFLPAFRRRLRAKLESTLRKQHTRRASSPTRSKQAPSTSYHIKDYALRHLDTITSPAPVYALSLAVFYFSGAYYALSKRAFGLRYVFTRKLTESDRRVGYEVLGVLLVLQMVVQAYIHMQDTLKNIQTTNLPSNAAGAAGGSVLLDGGVEITTEADDNIAAPLLFETHHGSDPAAQRAHLSKITHTPLPRDHHYDLNDPEVMQWIDGKQQRKCTLCLEPMKDPSVTTCGHAFCWSCITEWLREQPMCPLCRQNALAQHVLPLRG